MSRKTVVAGAIGIALIVAALPVGAAAYGDRIVPGVRAADLDLGGLTAARARTRLADAAVAFANGAVVVFGGGQVWTATNAELGLTLDAELAVRESLAIGRSGDVLARVREAASAASAGVDLGWPRRADGAALERSVSAIREAVERDPIDGAVTIDATGVGIRWPQVGVVLDEGALRRAILGSRHRVTAVGLELAARAPTLGEEAIAEAFEAALAAYSPLRIQAGSESVVVSRERVAQLVRFDTRGGGLAATLDERALAALVDEVAVILDGPARDAALVPGSERLTIVPGRDAVAVDRAGAAEAIAEALFRRSDGERVLALPAEVGPAAFPAREAERIAGDLRLAGTYTTHFPVNAARATNIGLAARRFNGVLVLPGQTFSFWERIGEVSARTGYVTAGTIIGGVSSEAIGGGLCQVSTTLFNAVIRAGLPVDERHAHSYYIERYPLGLDAAVLSPYGDLVWTNDTPFAVRLFGSSTATSVTFWLYSVPNGRTVELTAPLELNVRYPARDQPADPAHAPGYVVPGRDVWTVRIVRQGADELWRDVWYSHYEPVWGGPAR